MDYQFTLEILGKIWRKYLDRNDLLNSRLVCRSWNKESLNILNNSKFRHLLNGVYGDDLTRLNSLETFLKFAQDSKFQPPTFILPFKLQNAAQYYYRRNPDNVRRLENFASNVEILFNLFGNSCIKDLNFCIRNERDEEILCEILVRICDCVEILKIRADSHVNPAMSKSGFNILISDNNLKFPNLKLISLRYYSIPRENSINGEEDCFWVKFIEKCPSLENFAVDVRKLWNKPTTTWFRHIPTHLIDTLAICHDVDVPLSKINIQKGRPKLLWPLLVQLDIEIYTEKLQESPEQCLKIANLLANFSSTLEHLNLRIDDKIQDFSVDPSTKISIPFPYFPKVKYLGIWRGRGGDSPKMQFMLPSSCFPALEILSIAHDQEICLGDGDLNNANLFPNVNRVALRIKEKSDEPILENTESYMEHLARLSLVFPNMINIGIHSLLPLSGELNLETRELVTWVVKGIIQCVAAPNLKEIEFIDCFQDYVGIALSQIQSEKTQCLIVENVTGSDEEASAETLIATAEERTGIPETDLEIIQEIKENEDTGVVVSEKEPRILVTNLPKLERVVFRVSELGKKKITDADHSGSPPVQDGLLYGPKKLYLDLIVANSPLLKEIHLSPFYFGNNWDMRTKLLEELSTRFRQLHFKIV